MDNKVASGVTTYARFLVLSAVLILAYSLMASRWVGYSFTRHVLFAELPALLVFLGVVFFPSRGGPVSRALAAAAPVFLVLLPYACHDIFYYYVRRLPRVTDLENLPALFRVAGPLMSTLILLPLACVLIAAAAAAVRHYRGMPRSRILRGLLLRMALFGLLCLFLRSGLFDGYLQKDLDYTPWSEIRNVQRNGRLTTFIYYNNRRLEHVAFLKKRARSFEKDPRRWTFGPPRNVHVIVLESFLDPRGVRGLRFSRDPLSPLLKPFLRNGDFDRVISPAYGGGTAQAEFEILTGLPAMAKVDSVEFNVFEGYPTYSLCEALGRAGYACSACVASEPGYYNSRSAYRSLQFRRVDFLNMRNSYLRESPTGDRFLFDGDLLAMNLRYVRRCILKGEHVFNYVLGMYGHIPYTRNRALRPDVIRVTMRSGAPCPGHIEDIANQFYYRTEALGRFLTALRRIDPDCLVLVLSDHLPPVFGGGLTYRSGAGDLHSNIGFLLDRWRPIPLPAVRYYRLHYLLLSRLASESSAACPAPPGLDRLYYTELARAMGLVPRRPSRMRAPCPPLAPSRANTR